MKKNFSKILAAVVAIPVTASSILAVPTFAMSDDPDNVSVTLDKLLEVPGDEDTMTADATLEEIAEILEAGDAYTFTQVSEWNDLLGQILADVSDGAEVTIANEDLANLLGAGYYTDILSDILTADASEDAVAVYDASAKKFTITGSLDVSAYIQAEVDSKIADNPDYEGYDFTVDPTNMIIKYDAVIVCDYEAGKEMYADATFTVAGKTYTIFDISDYMDVLYEDVKGQIDAYAEEVEAGQLADADAQIEDAQAQLDEAIASGASDEKVSEKQAELDEKIAERDQKVADANADLAAMEAELEETIDKLKDQIDTASDMLAKATTATLEGTKSYSDAESAYTAMLKAIAKSYPGIASRLPSNATEAVNQYSSQISSIIDLVNDAVEQTGAKATIDISANDIATMMSAAYDIEAWTSAPGVLEIAFAIEEDTADPEYDAVYDYVMEELELINMTDEQVETVKKVTMTIDAATQTVAFDVIREVTIEAEVEETTTTTEETTTTTEETTTTTETDTTTETVTATDTVTDTDVTGTDVTGTDVTGTDVTGTDVTGTDVTGTDVTGTDVTGTDVTGTDATGSDADATTTTVAGTDVTGTDATGSDADVTTTTVTLVTGSDVTGGDADVTTTATGTDVTGGDADVTTATGTDVTGGGADVTTTATGTDVTGSDDTGSDADVTTTTEPELPLPDVVDIESVSAVVGVDYYYNTDTEFDATALISELIFTLTDGTTETIHVNSSNASSFFFSLDGKTVTPADLYASVDENTNEDGKIYYIGSVDVTYVDDNGDSITLAEQPEVAIAMRGDADLDGKMMALDSLRILEYYGKCNLANDEEKGTGPEYTTFIAERGSMLENLVYYISDIDTESKGGKDERDADGNIAVSISQFDGRYTLLFYAGSNLAADKQYTWDQILSGEVK